ncbi:uncharacterized protein LOC127103975 [Lathyrus oleraceus]|uniref:uncharacterized protein LOC127103975 n=1 Tax=Pisum sativum TaxID=3888 RepID=UPI0021D33FFC|nr:uncharacterized protein LOC127103975 [Pisum sativum]
MVDQRTLRELVAPDVNYSALYIEYPVATVPFELKSGLIHLLPRFNGLADEDPHRHLKEFQVVCSTPLRPKGITEDHINLRAFPFSLQGAAKYWLYYFEPNSITSWNNMKKIFLEIFSLLQRLFQSENKYVVLDRLTWNHWPNAERDPSS